MPIVGQNVIPGKPRPLHQLRRKPEGGYAVTINGQVVGSLDFTMSDGGARSWEFTAGGESLARFVYESGAREFIAQWVQRDIP